MLRKFSTSGGDGRHPIAPLIEASDGLLYGTTSQGGTTDADGYTYGTVFRLGKSGSGYQVLRKFLDLNDAQNPTGGLVQAGDGFLYGTTEFDGFNYAGAVFRMALDGSSYSVPFVFSSTDGEAPSASLIEASDGLLYGTTSRGGLTDQGTLFQLAAGGATHTLLHAFSQTGGDPGNLEAGLIEGSDGQFYGVSRNGGAANAGTVFQVSPDGSGLTILHSFATDGVDGQEPAGRLLEGSDGMLYGTTYYGGTTNKGTVFRLQKDGGGYAVLCNFLDYHQGQNPEAGLIEGNDGALYGTCTKGGSGVLYGTIFKLNKNGTGFATLYNFSLDRRNPNAPLIEGPDDYLYGTANYGGRPSSPTPGEVFRIRKDGSGYVTLHAFGGNDGQISCRRFVGSW